MHASTLNRGRTLELKFKKVMFVILDSILIQENKNFKSECPAPWHLFFKRVSLEFPFQLKLVKSQ